MNARGLALSMLALAMLTLAPERAHAWEWRDLLRSDNGHVEDGNERMRAGDHQGALVEYDKAAKQLPSEGGVHLNRGLALLAAGDLPKARESLLRATEPPASAAVRAAAYYNLGLAFYRDADAKAGEEDHEQAQSMFRESADALKRSLRLVPGNRDAAWNLELATRRIREEEEKQKQKQQEQEEQKQQEEQEKQDQDQQNQDPQDQEQQDQEQKPEPNDGQDPQDPQEKPEPKEPQQQPEPEAQPEVAEPREAERALDALQQGEESLERLRAQQRAGRERRQPTKDW